MRKLTVSSCLTLLVLLGSAGESVALPACESDVEVWNNCFAAWTFDTGNKYVGEWRNNKMHGQGSFTYSVDYDKEAEEGVWHKIFFSATLVPTKL